MSNIWFTADTHLGHTNMVLGETRWENPEIHCRDFQTVEEHDANIIDTFNKYVKPNDIVYHLGDVLFGNNKLENLKKYLRRYSNRDWHLILGNHDEDWILKSRNVEALSLFKSVHGALNKKIGGKRFSLHHYARRVWNKSHHGAIELHGHSHASLEDPSKAGSNKINQFYNNFKTLDVGVDNIYRLKGEYRPIHIDEVLKYMDKKEVLKFIDHHNKR